MGLERVIEILERRGAPPWLTSMVVELVGRRLAGERVDLFRVFRELGMSFSEAVEVLAAIGPVAAEHRGVLEILASNGDDAVAKVSEAVERALGMVGGPLERWNAFLEKLSGVLGGVGGPVRVAVECVGLASDGGVEVVPVRARVEVLGVTRVLEVSP